MAKPSVMIESPAAETRGSDVYEEIIAQLEREREALARAIAAVRVLANGAAARESGPRSWAKPAATGAGQKEFKLSAEARARMAEGQRRRYAAKRAAAKRAAAKRPAAKRATAKAAAAE